MATRIQTVEFPFATSKAGVASGANHDFSAITLILPEVASRTFRSVMIECFFRGTETVAASITAFLLGIKLGAVAFNDATVTTTLTNTGEQQSWVITRDVTSYFTSNFGSLPEQTCQVRVNVTGIPPGNIAAKLIITYEYDDTESLDTGTATSGAAGSLTNTGKSYTTDVHKHQYVQITGGTGSGQYRRITGNTGTVLSVTPNWSTNPDNTSTYTIWLGRVKTVRIPLDSPAAGLANTLTEIGTNQVPDLDAVLPEADKYFPQMWFEARGNDSNSGTTDHTLGFALDAEAADNTGNLEQALNSGNMLEYIWVRNDMDPTVAHAYKVVSSITNRFYLLTTVLNVTYVYNHRASSSLWVSIKFNVPLESDSYIGGATSADNSRHRVKFFVEEANVSLQQSAILVHYDDFGAIVGLNFRVGSQSYRAYTHGTGSVGVGGYCFQQRIDSGGAQGAGFTLARGENEIVCDIYRTSSTQGTLGVQLGLQAIINYTGDKPSAGAGVINHTVHFSLEDTYSEASSPRVDILTAAFRGYIPESDYWITAATLELIIGVSVTAAAATVEAVLASGEGPGDGWRKLGETFLSGESEIHYQRTLHAISDSIKRHPDDPDANRLDILAARTGKISLNVTGWAGLQLWLTYHAMTFTWSGTLAGFSTPDAQPVYVYRNDTKEHLYTATPSSGVYSITVYDSAIDMFGEVRASSTQLGRTDTGPAV